MEISDVINYLISLFIICNPIAALPALLNLTYGRSEKDKKSIVITATLAVIVILTVVTWIGLPLLNLLGIHIPAFQVAGGFVIGLIALSMLNAQPSRIQQTKEDEDEAMNKASIAVVPLAMPIIAGPGAMTTAIMGASMWTGYLDRVVMMLCGVCVAIVIGVVLYFATRIERVLKHTGINIVTRIGGLLLAAMAVQSIASGVHGLYLVFTRV
ncbi:MarC family protein [Rhabdochlamydiaceae symbiont of Dictyostelium giganteum]|uniref:MarC family protein n=1 Tax=Rhabdochlamydiaceae symbiont of Dictyostelium giganteum TaxID=3342349 RepID=UPI00384EA826